MRPACAFTQPEFSNWILVPELGTGGFLTPPPRGPAWGRLSSGHGGTGRDGLGRGKPRPYLRRFWFFEMATEGESQLTISGGSEACPEGLPFLFAGAALAGAWSFSSDF